MFQDGEKGEVGDAAMFNDGSVPKGQSPAALAEAEDDKQSVCIQTLVAGNGKAYIELFYLSHVANEVQRCIRLSHVCGALCHVCEGQNAVLHTAPNSNKTLTCCCARFPAGGRRADGGQRGR